MKNIIVWLLLLTLSSCATSMLQKKDREIESVVKTKMSKENAYSTALTYIAKNFGDSSKVIKMKNLESGTIVLKGNTSCNIFRQAGDINNYLLQFTLTIMLKNQKAKLHYENLYISSNTGNPIGWEYNRISSKEKLRKSMGCLDSLNKGLFESNNW